MNWRDDSLDPNDWTQMKQIGKRMLEDIFDYVQGVEKEKVWKPIDDKILQELNQPVPYEPQELEQCYKDFCDNILRPYSPMNLHPAFWGWVMGCGNPVGTLAEMITAGLNSNVIGGAQISCKVEEQVLQWFMDILDFPIGASGILTSGCSEAGLIALTVARNTVANEFIREQGLQHLPQKLVLYASQERHHSLDKAIEILGLGKNSIRLLPVDSEFRLCVKALGQEVKKDKGNGLLPFCVIGTVGTVNTGAIDNLKEIFEIATEEHLWFHIDGAFGALAALSPKYKMLVKDICLADSVAFDLHKWMYLPYGVGCVIIKNKESHFRAFAAKADYINHQEAWFSDYGIALSRGFSALKVWMCLKTYGVNRFAMMIEKDIQHAQYLAGLIRDNLKLELLAPVTLNIVCFRYHGELNDEEVIDSINRKIVKFLQLEGEVFPSETVIQNRYAIRVAITNYRSHKDNFDILLDKVIQLGNRFKSAFCQNNI